MSCKREYGHSDFNVNCRLRSAYAFRAGWSEAALYDCIRVCAKVDLLNTEKKYIKRKVSLQISLGRLRRLI